MPEKKKAKDGQILGLQQENVLEAVVVADSFDSRFFPVTSNQPKVLFPLANLPILGYTLEFLASCKVKKIYVYCCYCADQIKKYLLESKWNKKSSPCVVVPIVSHDLASIGDVFRDIDQKSLFESDFLFVPGDVVSNMKLKDGLEEHRVRRDKDKNKPLITLVMQNLAPCHRARSVENDVVVACDKATNQVLHYHQFFKNKIDKSVKFPLEIFRKQDRVVDLRYNLKDTGIWVCSPQVPPLFSDNFDYQTRYDFIRGILINEEFLGNQIHLHVVESSYCARVHNLHMYDVISRDVISRWTYPFAPDVLYDEVLSKAPVDNNRYKLLRRYVYLASSCVLGHNSEVVKGSVVGHNTTVGNNCVITDSVIGNGCIIEDNCVITGSYILNNVTIKSGCKVLNSLLCDNVKLFQNVKIQNRCLLCSKVSIGPDVILPTETVLRLQDDEFEEGDMETDKDLIGTDGKGFLWKKSEDADDESDDGLIQSLWGMSLHEHQELFADDNDASASEVSSVMTSDDERIQSEDDILVDDDLTNFQREVKESLHGGFNEKAQCDNLILEVNSSKYAYNVTIQDVVQTVTKSLFEIAAANSTASYFTSLKEVFDFFSPLLCNYNKTLSAQLTCLYAIEEHAASHENVAACLIKILMYLYDNDIVTEEAILKWNSNPDMAYLALLTPKQIRTKVAKFVQWLIEAEEEDSSDE